VIFDAKHVISKDFWRNWYLYSFKDKHSFHLLGAQKRPYQSNILGSCPPQPWLYFETKCKFIGNTV